MLQSLPPGTHPMTQFSMAVLALQVRRMWLLLGTQSCWEAARTTWVTKVRQEGLVAVALSQSADPQFRF